MCPFPTSVLMLVVEVAQIKLKPHVQSLEAHQCPSAGSTCLGLKINGQSLAIEKAVPCDDAGSSMLGKYVVLRRK